MINSIVMIIAKYSYSRQARKDLEKSDDGSRGGGTKDEDYLRFTDLWVLA